MRYERGGAQEAEKKQREARAPLGGVRATVPFMPYAHPHPLLKESEVIIGALRLYRESPRFSRAFHRRTRNLGQIGQSATDPRTHSTDAGITGTDWTARVAA